MITQYFKQVVVKFKPTSKGAQTARMFLAAIPPKSRGMIMVKQSVLEPNSSEPEQVKVTYKDGKVITVDPATIGNTYDMTMAFDQYSRSLKIQQDISDA